MDHLYDLYNVEQPEDASQMPEDEALAIDMHKDDDQADLGPEHIDIDMDMMIDDDADHARAGATQTDGHRNATPGSSKRSKSSKTSGAHGSTLSSSGSNRANGNGNGHANGNGSATKDSYLVANSPRRPASGRASQARSQSQRQKAKKQGIEKNYVQVISDDSDTGF